MRFWRKWGYDSAYKGYNALHFRRADHGRYRSCRSFPLAGEGLDRAATVHHTLTQTLPHRGGGNISGGE
jgi:hypothetical protein